MGRGGGGGSSGGRSFSSSSSSSRSFGGRSSFGPHRGGASFSSASHNNRPSFSGPPPGHRPPPPPMGPVHHHHYGGYGYGGRVHYISGRAVIYVMIALIALFVVLGAAGSGQGRSDVSKSTIERTAIEPHGAFDNACVDDRVDWIMDRHVLLRGMESFYKQTGVQPALCITDDLGGMDPEAYASDKYNELVGHEKGILLLFYEPQPSEWDAYYMAGRQAQTVMDSEACDILLDYVEAYYYGSNMTDDEYFAAVFKETGERIMAVTPTVASRMPMVLGVIVVIVLVFGVISIIKLKHKRAREEAAETERILHTHVDRL